MKGANVVISFVTPALAASVIGASLLVIGAIVGCVLHGMLLRRLRVRHPDLWQALGAPDRIFDDGGLASLEAVRRFYRDPELKQRCSLQVMAFARVTQLYGRAYLGFAVVTFGILLVCLWREM